ncbi:sensor histidine kinase [Arthrobacter sp. VKM Ac-2550]|uniref:sensor histidine kinase n=1 Tax=Crystallibacter permensis TaxID=1938888 RepID=UPI0022271E58|nr:HAMP domain-containing sensor histidine kinase [Arthrobacter sp. VKM Ac-2550]
MAATIALTSALTIALLRDNLVQRMDDDLSSSRENVSIWMLRRDLSGPNNPLTNYYAALLDSTGKPLRQSTPASEEFYKPDIKNLELDQVAASPEAFDLDDERVEGATWRARVYSFAEDSGFIVIALPYEDIDQTIEDIAAISLIIGLISTAAASTIAWAAITRAFKPLSKVEKTAAAIAAGDLSRRVNVESPATEIGRLSSSLNAMLAHIESAFAGRAASEKRMRQFVADASHELRTPLVTIRGFSELYRHGALQTQDDVGAAMGRIESEATRMGQLVEDLLTLARVDEQRPLEAKPLDLLLLGNDAAMDARASAPDRDIKVIGLDGAGPQSAPIVGDEGRLRQVVANLMTNALRYTPEGSPIEIAVGVEPVIDDKKDSVIEVRDHGPGVSEEEAARVFERFYRADSSRYRETGGTGLGLAIVAALVAQHDGTVRLLDTEGGGATMSIRIPYEPAPDDDRSVFEYN